VQYGEGRLNFQELGLCVLDCDLRSKQHPKPNVVCSQSTNVYGRLVKFILHCWASWRYSSVHTWMLGFQ
jgi:hypothetical protein